MKVVSLDEAQYMWLNDKKKRVKKRRKEKIVILGLALIKLGEVEHYYYRVV